MTLVLVHTHPLGADQKKRIEEALTSALHQEGLHTNQGILFTRVMPGLPETEGGNQANTGPTPEQISPEFKTRARRTRAELLALKGRLAELLKANGTLTSLEARQLLGLAHCNWAPPTLRRIFGELEQEGLAVREGLKRSTRYAYSGCQEGASLRD